MLLLLTPPCQGFSALNQKKNSKEINRNSLVIESIHLIKEIKPKFFIFENVANFFKSECLGYKTIEDLFNYEFKNDYSFHYQVINFKQYGSLSSRKRTLIIGVQKNTTQYIQPLELMPVMCKETILQDVVLKFKPLQWGQFDEKDFYHQFRTYASRMKDWIKDLKSGQSAFDNPNIEQKPHKIINNQIVVNKNKLGKKYYRNLLDKVAPCVHTRTDTISSQNTIHPYENRVFSIRELMEMMTIPFEFKWINQDLNYLNNLPYEEKIKILKQHELNIRQSIGEAVPTFIFKQIALKIKSFSQKITMTNKEILLEIEKYELYNVNNLKEYIVKNKKLINFYCLTRIVEFANKKRMKNSAFFTNQNLISIIVEYLPSFNNQNEITIMEPSVGCGNFLPFLFKKYQNKKVNLIVNDIDPLMIDLLKVIYDTKTIPKNFSITFICQDFLKIKEMTVDLIIGNPPFSSDKINNLGALFLDKSLIMSQHVSLILPKNFLSAAVYEKHRQNILIKNIESIIDFKDKGFLGVSLETINLTINKIKKTQKINVYDFVESKTYYQSYNYICDKNLPYWVIYRNNFFDKIYKKMKFDIFDVFRDRQITKKMLVPFETNNKNIVRVLRSKNIQKNDKSITKIIDIPNYDFYINKKDLEKLSIRKYYNKSKLNVYMTPNMSYNPRIIKKTSNFITNGSIALLLPKQNNIDFSLKDMKYIASKDFKAFYEIARNYQKKPLI